MRRTRKWAYVAQEAHRLADLNLSPREIAKRLGVNHSTVTRWMADGRLRNTVRAHKAAFKRVEAARKGIQTPEEWAASVREAYALDATDSQLVTLAEAALAGSLDESQSMPTRMVAAGRFQAIVKQLALVTRIESTAESVEPKRKGFQAPQRSGVDPRSILSAV